MMNAMKTQNMKAGVMGGARQCLVQVARKIQRNSDARALAMSVFMMPRPPYRGDMKRGSRAAKPYSAFSRRISARRRGPTSAAHEHGLAVGERTTASHRGKEQI